MGLLLDTRYVLAQDIANRWDVYWTLVTGTYLLRVLLR
jgi:hypothetical protein